MEFFDKTSSFVIWHKLTKFHEQAVFTSQEIQKNVFLVLCLGIWWRHETKISKILKNIFSRTKRAFEAKQKAFFLVSQVLVDLKNKLPKMSQAQPLTLFRMGAGSGQKGPPTSFSPVTSTNVRFGSQIFLTFNFDPFAILVQNFQICT